MKTNESLDSAAEISPSQIHHLAWLNWVKDGRPPGQDMEYWMAAEMLLAETQTELTVKVKKQVNAKAKPTNGKTDCKFENTARVSVRYWNAREG